MLINDQITKTISNPWQDTFKQKSKLKMNCISQVTTFTITLPLQAQITQNHWDIMKLNPNFKYIFQEPVIPYYHRPNILWEMIDSNKILHNKVTHKKPTIKSTKFCQPWNISTTYISDNLFGFRGILLLFAIWLRFGLLYLIPYYFAV